MHYIGSLAIFGNTAAGLHFSELDEDGPQVEMVTVGCSVAAAMTDRTDRSDIDNDTHPR